MKTVNNKALFSCAEIKSLCRDYSKYVKKFKGLKVLVIGDIMVDEYLYGKCRRISPEAPVPIVEVAKREYRPGGASNVAKNLLCLGAEVSLAGVIGQDGIGRLALELFRKENIDTSLIVCDPCRPSTLKTRIIAHNQQIARTDIEKSQELEDGLFDKVCASMKNSIDKYDAIVISDYSKGFVSKKLLDFILPLAKKNKTVITVDPKVKNFYHYKSVSCITPNRKELSDVLGYEVETDEQLVSGGKSVLNDLSLDSLLVTLGEAGMCLYLKNGETIKIPACARTVYDVTGAGDTVISVFTLALAAGMDFKNAAVLSNVAAGEVVAMFGTSAISADDLIMAVKSHK